MFETLLYSLNTSSWSAVENTESEYIEFEYIEFKYIEFGCIQL